MDDHDPVTDDELAAEALAADPDAPVADDAVPFGEVQSDAIIGDWYMPAASAGASTSSAWRKRVAVGVVGSIALVNAAGLCVTYGHITLG